MQTASSLSVLTPLNEENVDRKSSWSKDTIAVQAVGSSPSSSSSHDFESKEDAEGMNKDESAPSPSTSSPSSASSRSQSKYVRKEALPPQLFHHLDSAKDKALTTFEEIQECQYASANIGKPPENEAMICDCRPHWVDGVNVACGHGSNCINRMTSIECTDEDNVCGPSCQNQRFQRHEFAKVDVFLTEKKGFGLRADANLPKDTFVYEYIGEVIPEQKFRKRMRQYDSEGIKHFYFMMLQKGEYIDATKRGSLARFCNHSCRPNCYVDKWMVGDKLRMGIFCKRDIIRGEELTFDYNVDRYGAQAQPCYCGEPCCVGYIGGKTQTEAQSKLPENVREALGIEDEEDSWENITARRQRRKKGIDETSKIIEEVQPTPLTSESATKVIGVLLQTKDDLLTRKLMERIFLTSDPSVCRSIIALRGYNIFGLMLKKFSIDIEFILRSIKTMLSWPRLTRNKIQDSNIEPVVQEFCDHENEEVKDHAKTLLKEWESLEIAYRIPRRKPGQVAPQSTNAEPSNNQSNPPLRDQEPQRGDKGDIKSAINNSTEDLSKKHPALHSSRPSDSRSRSKFGNDYQSHSKHNLFRKNSFPKRRRLSNSDTPSETTTPNNEQEQVSNQANKVDLNKIISAAMESVNQKNVLKAQKEEEERIAQQKREEKRRLAYEESLKRHAKKLHEKKTKSSQDATIDHHLTSHSPESIAFKAVLAKFFANKTARYQEKLGKAEFKLRVKKMTEIILKKHIQLVLSKKEKALPDELSDSQQRKLRVWAFRYLDTVVSRSGTATTTPTDSPSIGESPKKAA
ncbi:Histone-lysine N-methyltransferase, H3 lysine-36 specific [Schizosaccharomyces pombe]|uniref:Histone-lysine N-methyltransferase, H3 lysine-36 specific n=1 Tax=Schizosaccharomyces pombe (strain 972 / ATCC 24843) TaxID=284812 RepID=SET2_SCHPO|nr:histone lysine methyltransferase Set2 [Schizosaccharomyces pombe]O14026.1 RecName: Full=Histone-lysine N-methyltransferase, H3 lysine-36 specific; AltName: Full=Lysine N-methyltransferase 3; AltName: Full=SET domain-containing protein 2 [Schizosaccharomyces pombe 972h-]CAB16247.1 histone lysine methyltransferase Set2 [Schizosaccharomyces pombe]|eukprot:NP_594980.1 histone lysine methyltransferase Set2 [Schizosaccharomyces pombe]